MADGRVLREIPGDRPLFAVDLGGRSLQAALVNGHDHLDTATLPALGRPPYGNASDWTRDLAAAAADPALRAGLAVPLVDRLFLGAVRNLLGGAAAVAHHGSFHRALGRDDFPLRVLERYDFALSPAQTPALRRSYRTTDRRIPWLVHAAEGTDAAAAAEIDALAAANVLRQNTVVMHGIALSPADLARMAAAKACLVWSPEADRRLYAATAPVAAARAAGVRVGLGTGSAATGARDPLSTLAAARAEGVLDDDALLAMAAEGTAEVVRLPVGSTDAGAPADLLVVGSREGLLQGRRDAIDLLLSRGRPLLGAPELMAVLAPDSRPCRVDGAERRLDAEVARRLAGLLRAHPALLALGWLQGVALS